MRNDESPLPRLSDVSLGLADGRATKRVRILVAIDANGRWGSGGYDYGQGSDPKEWVCTEDLGRNISFFWIEADVPIPSDSVIQGEVRDE